MINKLWEHKKIRFLCVGSFNSITDLLILNALVFIVGTPVWVANAISVSFGITLSYFLNHFIVFRHHHSPNFKSFAKFLLATGISVIALQTAIIYLVRPAYKALIQHTHTAALIHLETKLSLNLAKITAIFIGMGWNYMFYSHVIFAKRPPSQADNEVRDITNLV
ncbi:MAG TPA: GtrA family protein [Candidatus Saccharimonadales bacterium]|jgi:putative flippase GtrA|nr:GtrA family protein [Candidatus Saccharimonadales bacterium]